MEFQLQHQFTSVQSLSRVQLFATPWTAARQASPSFTISCMSIESVMTSNHLILFYPLLLPPSIFLSIRVFSSESVLCIRWPKYWSFSFSVSPSNEHSGLSSFRMDWILVFQGHIILKPRMQDFKHDLTSMGDECNCLMVSIFFSTTLLGNWDED